MDPALQNLKLKTSMHFHLHLKYAFIWFQGARLKYVFEIHFEYVFKKLIRNILAALLSVTQIQINLVSGYKASMLILKRIWNMTHKYICNASHFGRYLTLFILVEIWHKRYTLLKTYLLMQLKLKTNYLFRVPGFLGKKARYALKWNIHNLIYIYKLYIFTMRISHENYIWEYP